MILAFFVKTRNHYVYNWTEVFSVKPPPLKDKNLYGKVFYKIGLMLFEQARQ